MAFVLPAKPCSRSHLPWASLTLLLRLKILSTSRSLLLLWSTRCMGDHPARKSGVIAELCSKDEKGTGLRLYLYRRDTSAISVQDLHFYQTVGSASSSFQGPAESWIFFSLFSKVYQASCLNPHPVITHTQQHYRVSLKGWWVRFKTKGRFSGQVAACLHPCVISLVQYGQRLLQRSFC